MGCPASKRVEPLQKEDAAACAEESPMTVSKPTFRGIRLGRLIDFFKEHCGDVYFQDGEGGWEPCCVATKLTRLCIKFNQQNKDAIIKGEVRELAANLYAVDKLLIRPQTSKHQVSMAELWSNGDGVLVDVFVSHFWGEDFGEFCQSTFRFALKYVSTKFAELSREEVHSRARDLGLYVCAFSNNQWNIKAEMGSTIEESPFYRVMQAETTQVVTMNLDQPAAALLRAWCSFEFYLAHSLKKPFYLSTQLGALQALKADMKITEVWLSHMFEILYSLDIRNSRASYLKDYDMIMERVATYKGAGVAAGLHGADALNLLLRSMVANQVLPLFASIGCVEGLRQALESKANPDSCDHRDVPALTLALAAHGRNSEVVQMLLTAEADARYLDHAEDVVRMFDANMGSSEQAMKRIMSSADAHRFYLPALESAHIAHATKSITFWRSNRELQKTSSLSAAAEAIGNSLSLWGEVAGAQFSRGQIESSSHLRNRSLDVLKQQLHLALKELLAHGDPQVRVAAFATLAGLPHMAADFEDDFLRGLDDGDGAVRAASAQALSQAALPDFWPKVEKPLFALIRDGEAAVRRAAAQAIAALGGLQAKEQVWDITEKAANEAKNSRELRIVIEDGVNYGFKDRLGPSFVNLAKLFVAEDKGIPFFVDLPLGPTLNETMAVLSTHAGLYKLVLKTCEIDENSAEALAKWIEEDHEGTTEMYLNGNTKMASGTAVVFEALAKNKSLKCVAMPNCGIKDGEAEVLLQLLSAGKLNLIELNIQNNGLSDDMKSKLEEAVTKCPRLDSLQL